MTTEKSGDWEISPEFADNNPDLVAASGGDGYGYYFYYKRRKLGVTYGFFAPPVHPYNEIMEAVKRNRRSRQEETDLMDAAKKALNINKQILEET